MIELIPSKGFQKAVNIDFDIVNAIFNQVFKSNIKASIKVCQSRLKYSAFYIEDLEIHIDLKEGKSLKYIFEMLLHETRHFFQMKHFKNKLVFCYNSYEEYYNSPEEKDARKFEKLSTDFCRIYNSFVKVSEKLSKNQMISFKELSDNMG